MQVSELMNRNLITVAPGDSVEEALKLLRQQGIRHLLAVVQGGETVGIVTETDLLRYFAHRGMELERQAETAVGTNPVPKL